MVDSIFCHLEKSTLANPLEALKHPNLPIKLKNVLRYVLIVFMLVAGLNHFIHPEFYYPLIPSYLPLIKLINLLSGISEVIAALMLLHPEYRNWGAIGIIVLLILFIPSHVHFIQMGACVPKGLCTPVWLAWVRLLLIHPLLIYWAWYIRI